MFNNGSVFVTFVCAIGIIPKAIIPEVVAHASSSKPFRKGLLRAKNASPQKREKKNKKRLLFLSSDFLSPSHLVYETVICMTHLLMFMTSGRRWLTWRICPHILPPRPLSLVELGGNAGMMSQSMSSMSSMNLIKKPMAFDASPLPLPGEGCPSSRRAIAPTPTSFSPKASSLASKFFSL
jgi:hypothetical protein